MSATTNLPRYSRGDTGVSLLLSIESQAGAEVSLTGATNAKVHIQDPSGTVKEYTATITLVPGDDPDTIQYEIESSDILHSRGWWEYWASYTDADGNRRVSYDRFGFWVT